MSQDNTPAVIDNAPDLLAIIARAASDPSVNVDKMAALLSMHKELMADQARAEFHAAFARLSGKLPRVKKNGTVQLGTEDKPKGSYAFTRWEDIDRVIRPLLDDEGLALTFNSQLRAEAGGGLVVTGTLMHRDGHSISASMPLPLDTGPGRNNLQATGSTLSYGKRYVAEMLLNIVREGEDDDGVKGGLQPITAEQISELAARCVRLGVSLDSFCRTLAVESLADLDQSAYPIAANLLNARERRAPEKRKTPESTDSPSADHEEGAHAMAAEAGPEAVDSGTDPAPAPEPRPARSPRVQTRAQAGAVKLQASVAATEPFTLTPEPADEGDLLTVLKRAASKCVTSDDRLKFDRFYGREMQSLDDSEAEEWRLWSEQHWQARGLA